MQLGCRWLGSVACSRQASSRVHSVRIWLPQSLCAHGRFHIRLCCPDPYDILQAWLPCCLTCCQKARRSSATTCLTLPCWPAGCSWLWTGWRLRGQPGPAGARLTSLLASLAPAQVRGQVQGAAWVRVAQGAENLVTAQGTDAHGLAVS